MSAWVWQALAGLAVVIAYAALAAWCGAAGMAERAAEREWKRVGTRGNGKSPADR